MNDHSTPHDGPSYEEMLKIFREASQMDLSQSQQADLASVLARLQQAFVSHKVLAQEYLRLRQAVVDFGSSVVPLMEKSAATGSDTVPAAQLAPLVRRLLEGAIAPSAREGKDAS
jgi:hypothetical protein